MPPTPPAARAILPSQSPCLCTIAYCPQEIGNLMKSLHGYPPIITLFRSVVVLLFARAITASKDSVHHVFMNRKGETAIAFKILGLFLFCK